MAEKLNTTKSMKQAPTVSDAQLKDLIKRAKVAFGEEKQVNFSVPPAMKAAVGADTLFIGVNGVQVNIPIDGTKVPLPETLAKHGNKLINSYK